MFRTRRRLLLGLAALGAGVTLGGTAASAASARTIDAQASQALSLLFETQPKARELAARSRAILVFPKIFKAGFIVGGQSGNGVLRVGGKVFGYYNLSAASFGCRPGGSSSATRCSS